MSLKNNSSISGKAARDGDLPPGVYERLPDGTLVPTNKMLTSAPPRPLPKHISGAGIITDLSRQDIEYVRDVVREHYEQRDQKNHNGAGKRTTFYDMVMRAAEDVMRGAK